MDEMEVRLCGDGLTHLLGELAPMEEAA